jgi:hypothetical protein
MNKLVAVVGINVVFLLVAACDRNRGNGDDLGANAETGGNGTQGTLPDNGNASGGTSADGTMPGANNGNGTTPGANPATGVVVSGSGGNSADRGTTTSGGSAGNAGSGGRGNATRSGTSASSGGRS